MADPDLQYDVVTLSGETLLPAGTRLEGQVLAELSSRRSGRICRSYSFAGMTELREDLRKFLAEPPYDTIFSDQEETGEVLWLMDQGQLLEPEIDSLDYFREHDFYTYRHSLMVFALVTLLAKNLYPGDKSSLLKALAGPSHDLGKICVPPHILQKGTPLNRVELSHIKHHALAGYVILAYYSRDFVNLVTIVARDHHERRDGSGYPRGINGASERVEIVILSDIYDALISPRPYRPISFDNRSALEELTLMAEQGQIGWRALRALVAFNRRSRPDFRTCAVSQERRGRPPVNNVYGRIVKG